MNNPVVTVKNNTRIDIFVVGDSNWDDQKLLFNGRFKRGGYTLTKGATVKVSTKVDYPAMGVEFYRAQSNKSGDPGLYVTVDQDQTGNLAITEEVTYPFDASADKLLGIKYAVSDQAPLSMTMTFTDAS